MFTLNFINAKRPIGTISAPQANRTFLTHRLGAHNGTLVIRRHIHDVNQFNRNVTRAMSSPDTIMVLSQLHTVTSDTVGRIRHANVNRFVDLALLPKVDMVRVLLRKVRNCNRRVNALLTDNLHFNCHLISVNLIIQISKFARAVRAPIMIEHLHIRQRNSHGRAGLATANEQVSSRQLVQVLFNFVKTNLNSTVLVGYIPRTHSTIDALIPKVVQHVHTNTVPRIFHNINRFYQGVRCQVTHV